MTGDYWNCYYFCTGEINKIIVLDLDDMEDEYCQKMREYAEACCEFIVKTRKGFHYYFLYEDDFKNTIHGKSSIDIYFDILSNGAHIYCPPGTYTDYKINEKFSYELIKSGKKVKKMSNELRNYIIDVVLKGRKNNQSKSTEQTELKINKKTPSKDKSMSQKERNFKSNNNSKIESTKKTEQKPTRKADQNSAKKKDSKSIKKEDAPPIKKEDIKLTKKEDTKSNKKGDIKSIKKENTKSNKEEDTKSNKKEEIKSNKKEDTTSNKKEDIKSTKKKDTKSNKNVDAQIEKSNKITERESPEDDERNYESKSGNESDSDSDNASEIGIESESDEETDGRGKGTYEDKILIRVIDGLNASRAGDTESWIKASFAFYNSGIDVKYFDYFSKKKNYAGYEEIYVHYKKLKYRNDDDKRRTISTIWFWLMEDDYDLFIELRRELEAEKYKIDIELNESFKAEKFSEIVERDNKELKEFFYPMFRYTRSFQYFNRFHVWVYSQSAIYKIDNEDPPMSYQKDPFPDVNIEKYVTIGKKTVINYHNFIEIWKKAPKKKVKYFVFDPSTTLSKGETVNLFEGFKFTEYEEVNMEDIQVYLDHIKHLCDNEVMVYEYVLNWIAHIFQKPYEKTTVTLVFYSDTQGVGKNITTDVLRILLGKYYLKLSNTGEFAEHFNSHFQHRLLAVCDEVKARARDIADELKDVISRTEFKITYKGKEPFYLKDYCNYILTTNNQNVLRVPISDRRFMIIGCPEEKLKQDIIDKLVKIQKDEKLLGHIFTYFRKRDISNFDPKKIVMTKYKLDLIAHDLPAYIKMIIHRPEDFANKTFTSKKLYSLSVDYLHEFRIIHVPYEQQKCFKDLTYFLKITRIQLLVQFLIIFPEI